MERELKQSQDKTWLFPLRKVPLNGCITTFQTLYPFKKNTNKYQSIPPIEKYNIWNNDSKESIPNAGNNAEKKIMLGNQGNYKSNKSAVHKSGATYWSN